MGLDTSHGCWHGAYSSFMRWREMLAEVAGLPPLEFMEGFYVPNSPHDILYWAKDPIVADHVKRLQRLLPIKWDCLKPDPLHELLHHSDCEGEIPAESCGPIADSLEKLLPLLPEGEAGGHIGYWRTKTQQFIDGLRLAASLGENVEFH